MTAATAATGLTAVTAAGTVHVVVPDGIDDPARPSGGNVYDRHVCAALAANGWTVRELGVAGSWPAPDGSARATLAERVAAIPDRSVVLVDGLIASVAPDVLVPAALRLRLAVLVHLPLGHRPGPGDGADEDDVRRAERAVLASAAEVVVTSPWTRRWLLEHYRLPPAHVHVAEPGVDHAELAPGTAAGGELLCVAAVTPGKGHDVLLAALATVADQPWRLELVGSLTRDPACLDRLTNQADDCGIGDRVRFAGVRTGADLDRSYAGADVLVLASRAETYGMVVTEALARGLPVVATDVGGLASALGRAPDGHRPGLLVPPDDPAALAAALRSWLADPGLRQRLRRAAEGRRATLPGWSGTSAVVSSVLTGLAR